MSQLSDFLDFIWGDTDGYGCIALKESNRSFKKVYPKWPEQKSNVVDFIISQSAQLKEVYVTPSLWKSKVPTGLDAGEVKNYFKSSRVLWADMDGNAPEEWASEIIPEPTLKLQSSSPSNQHLYWLLEEPISDVTVLESKNRVLAYTLNADPGGWDAPQLLRPPETTNYGYGKDERKGVTFPVFIESFTNKTYSPEIVEGLKDFRPVILNTLGKVPPLRDVLGKHTYSEKFWEVFSTDKPPEGKRSDYMQAVAYHAAENGFTSEEIYALVLDCDDRWKKYINRTDRHLRLVDFVERAKAKYPTGLNDLTFAGLTGGEDKLKTLYNFKELMELEIKMDYLIEGILPVQGYGMIAAPPGTGKSQLALRLAEKFVSGEPWLGWKNMAKRKVVQIFSLEMNAVELKEFFSTMQTDGKFLSKPEEANNYYIVPVGETIPLDTEEGRAFFEREIDKVKPDLVIIDSLSKSLKGSFKDDNVVFEYNRYLTYVRRKYNLSLVTIHHSKKNQDKRFDNIDQDDLYGSTYLAQDLSFLLMMKKDKKVPNLLNVNLAKVRFSKELGEFKLERTRSLDFWVSEGAIDAVYEPAQTGLGAFADSFHGLQQPDKNSVN